MSSCVVSHICLARMALAGSSGVGLDVASHLAKSQISMPNDKYTTMADCIRRFRTCRMSIRVIIQIERTRGAILQMIASYGNV